MWYNKTIRKRRERRAVVAFCDNCGKWVKEGARFCLHCGMDQLPRRADFSAANPMPRPLSAEAVPPTPDYAGEEAPVAAEAAPASGVLGRVRTALKWPQPARQTPIPLSEEEIPAPIAGEAYAIMDMDPAPIAPEEALPVRPMPISRSPGVPVYLVQLLLMLLPLVGLVIAFIWAFTDERNIQRRDLARAVLIAYLIIALLMAAMLLVLGPSIRAYLFDPLQGQDPFLQEPDGADGFFDQFDSTPRGSSRV